MAKIIYITDTHGMASVPKSRLDDYPEAILRKMEYIGQYAKEIGAVAVIHGGDWLHTPDVSSAFTKKLTKILYNYPCDIFGVLGNHDIYGYNPDSFDRTPFSIAGACDVFYRLGKEPTVLKEKIGEVEHNVVSVTGQDSYFDLDKPGNISDYSDSKTTDGLVNIHVVHGMLVEKEWPQVSCTTLAQVMDANPNADIILSGHEHTGFGVKEFYRPDGVNKVIFCNPGSLARLTAGTGDIRKDVRMAVINIEKNDFSIELVNLPLDIAKPSSEVIDSNSLMMEKERKKNFEAFMEKIKRTEVNTTLGLHESLKVMGEAESIPEDVINECANQLRKAEEQLKTEA